MPKLKAEQFDRPIVFALAITAIVIPTTIVFQMLIGRFFGGSGGAVA